MRMTDVEVLFGDGPEDFRQAGWLDHVFQRSWRYDHTAGRWHHWNGVRWAPDQTRQIHKAVADAAYGRIRDDTLPRLSADQAKALMKLLNVAAIDKALIALSSFDAYGTDGSDWDQDVYLLGCNNGIVDLRENALVVTPDPSMLVTKTTGRTFTPISEAAESWDRAPKFMKFLHEITSGDDTMMMFLLSWFGASIFGFSPEQRFLLMTGIGRNGKGALKHAIMKAVGDYGVQPDANVYMRTRFGAVSSDKPRADLMALKGKRVGFFSEPEGGRFNEEVLKAHTGGDMITARALNSNNVMSWEATHSITFLVNDAPEIDDLGPSMAARVMVADFRERYDGEREDKQLYGKLVKEADGILAILCWFAQQWYLRWKSSEGGLVIPQRVLDQSKQFMERNDPVAHCIDEAFFTGQGHEGAARGCYEAYVQWHARSGEEGEPMSNKRFASILEKKGFKKTKRPSGIFYIGLQPKSAVHLAADEEDDEE